MILKTFDTHNIKNFLKWAANLDKESICKDFINKIELNETFIIFNINDVKDDYYDVPLKDFNSIEEELIYALQSELEFIDEDLNTIFMKELDFPDDALHFIDVYIENRETGLNILYGTYYPEGFEEKYELTYSHD